MYPQIKAHLATNKMETCECLKHILSQIKRKKTDQIKYLETMLFVDAYKI